MSTLLLSCLLWFVVWGFIGYLIGSAKGQAISGVVWPVLLGPVGLLIVLALPPAKSGK